MNNKLIKRLVIVAVCLVVITVLYIVLMHWMGGSSDGTVRVDTPSSQIQTVPQPLHISNHYFATTLPTGFTLKQQSTKPDNIAVLRVLADTSTGSDQIFAATVGKLPGEGLSGIGDYNLRTTQTRAYASYTPKNLPDGAVAFRTVNEQPAFTVFWPHNGDYFELALSTDSGATYAQLQTTFTQIMHSWQWK